MDRMGVVIKQSLSRLNPLPDIPAPRVGDRLLTGIATVTNLYLHRAASGGERLGRSRIKPMIRDGLFGVYISRRGKASSTTAYQILKLAGYNDFLV